MNCNVRGMGALSSGYPGKAAVNPFAAGLDMFNLIL